MKRVLLCFLPLALAACNPFPKTEDEVDAAAAKKAAAEATPKPTPKPGAWMDRKSAVPLSAPDLRHKQGNPLDSTKDAKERGTNPLERKAFKN